MTLDFLGGVVPMAHHDPGAGIEYRHCPTTTERGRQMTESLNGDLNRPACVPFPTFEAFREETDRRLRFLADQLSRVTDEFGSVHGRLDRHEARLNEVQDGVASSPRSISARQAFDDRVWDALSQYPGKVPAYILADNMGESRGPVGTACARLTKAGRALEEVRQGTGSTKKVQRFYRAIIPAGS